MELAARVLERVAIDLREVELQLATDDHRPAELHVVHLAQAIRGDAEPVRVVSERFFGDDDDGVVLADGVVDRVRRSRRFRRRPQRRAQVFGLRGRHRLRARRGAVGLRDGMRRPHRSHAWLLLPPPHLPALPRRRPLSPAASQPAQRPLSPDVSGGEAEATAGGVEGGGGVAVLAEAAALAAALATAGGTAWPGAASASFWPS